MRIYIKYISISLLFVSLGVGAAIGLTWFKPVTEVGSKSNPSSNVHHGYVMPSSIVGEIELLNKAHASLDNSCTISSSYDIDPQNPELRTYPDSIICYRFGKNIMVEQNGITKIQTEKHALMIIPDEEEMVIQDPDQNIYKLQKFIINDFQADSLGFFYSKAQLSEGPNQLRILTLWPAFSDDIDKIEIRYSAATHLISSLTEFHIIEDDEGHQHSFERVTELNYETVTFNEFEDFFKSENFYFKNRNGKYFPVKDFDGYEVFNSTKSAFTKNIKSKKRS